MIKLEKQGIVRVVDSDFKADKFRRLGFRDVVGPKQADTKEPPKKEPSK